jgi:uncharacterized protein with HEPN domain
MSERDRRLLLEDMLEAALKIKRYTQGYDENAFLSDDKTLDAVIRNFEIIGEAAGRIDDAFKFDNTELSWTHLRGFRNRIVHEYFGIDYEVVWTIIERDLDTYIEWLEVYLSDAG